MNAWDFVREHDWRIRNLARRMAPERADEVYSEMIVRLPRVLELFDERINADPEPYVFRNLKWYAYKYLMKLKLERTKHEDHSYNGNGHDESETLCSDAGASIERRDDIEEARYIVGRITSQLEEYDIALLRLHNVEGMSFASMAVTLGVSRVTAFRHYSEALQRAREAARRIKSSKEDTEEDTDATPND